MTLNTLIKSLRSVPSDAPVIFATALGEIGSGYHVTELKHLTIKGIDCGARRSDWSEASMQLLDGRHGMHMEAGKLAGIVGKSIQHLPELGAAALHVEFAHKNEGLRNYSLDAPELKDGKVHVKMHEVHAVCKPAHDLGTKAAPGQCCAPTDQSGQCCA